MDKLESLINIIDQLSADNGDTITCLCHTIQEYGYCSGIKCDECPFNSGDNMLEVASKLNDLPEPSK